MATYAPRMRIIVGELSLMYAFSVIDGFINGRHEIALHIPIIFRSGGKRLAINFFRPAPGF